MSDQMDLLPPGAAANPFKVLAQARAQARARAADPVTSYEAAERVEVSGVAQRQRDEVLSFVRQRPGLSSKQLGSQHCGEMTVVSQDHILDRYAFARRLPELRDAGLVGHRRHSPPTGLCREDTEYDGRIEAAKFNSAIHTRASDGAAAWWPTEGAGE